MTTPDPRCLACGSSALLEPYLLRRGAETVEQQDCDECGTRHERCSGCFDWQDKLDLKGGRCAGCRQVEERESAA